ncbi:MAG: sodium:solute symporter [Bacteroidia bacterium]
MHPGIILSILGGYFLFLVLISYFTARKATDNATFFVANKNAPWYLVAFGMIGASLSGVTFISLPGWVGSTQFSYFQVVLGYMVGYFVIATVLMPLYYRLNLTTIYTYLETRFGKVSHKTGSFFFLLSRTIGSAFRLYLVAVVFQVFIFDKWGMPFWVSVFVSLMLILVYTFRGGIKTIIWTDTLQTLFMLLALITTIIYVVNTLDLGFFEITREISQSNLSRIFFFDDWRSPQYFYKQFISGAFIAIVMTGLDQDMMQKNLTCRSLRDAQKNMFTFSITLLPVNLLFLGLGVLLLMFASANNIPLPERTDYIYPSLAMDHLPAFAGIVFLLGLTAAAYSSADSALAALTTSICVDFLGFKSEEVKPGINNDPAMVTPATGTRRVRSLIHIGITVLLFFVIMIFHRLNDESVINAIFKIAGYTYGPLLGLFVMGIFTKKKVRDRWVVLVCFLSPILTFIISLASEGELGALFMDYSAELGQTIDIFAAYIFQGYRFSFELLLINGLLTFIGLLLISKPSPKNTVSTQ